MDRETWEFINSFSPWLSAFGTIAAVIVALYLARIDKQVRLEVTAGIRLMVTPGMSGPYPEYLVIRIVNIGHREAQITNIGWKVGILKKKLAVRTIIEDGLSSDLPARLKDGQEASYYIPLNERTNWLKDFVHDFLLNRFRLRSRFIRVTVHTSIGKSFQAKIEKGLRDRLLDVATKNESTNIALSADS
ncbi:MAG: hypothetical protein JRJ77_16135 [Deltaproteobacteria bacterium]|nr:hypothetical protein [Deltaproteobacteria bacterium]